MKKNGFALIFSIIFSLGLVSPCLGVESENLVGGVPFSKTTRPLLQKIISFQKWRPLGASAVGLLVMNPIQGIAMIDHGRMVNDRANAYQFVQEDDSPNFTYFPSTGKPDASFLAHWIPPKGNGYSCDVKTIGKGTPNPWGLSDDVHIVKVEVNGGNGGGDGIFVASRVEILPDDSKLKLAPRLRAFLKPYSDAKSAEAKHVASRLEEIIARVKKLDPRLLPVKNDEGGTWVNGFSVHWLSESGDLNVIYYARRTYRAQVGSHPGYPTHPGGPLGPPWYSFLKYGAEYARIVTYDRSGKIKSDREDGGCLLWNIETPYPSTLDDDNRAQ